MDNFLFFSLRDIPFIVISIAIAFSVHEFAHAFVAYKFGDPTAKDQGRLTLSPFAHLDFLGTVFIFILGFGWAKPVPVNRFYFKRPRLASILVSLAGPLSNFILMLIGFFIWYSITSEGLLSIVNDQIGAAIHQFFNLFILLNIILCIFNLLPFPPLDGYRIVLDLVPSHRLRIKVTQLEKYGGLILLIIVLTPINKYTIIPLFDKVIPFIFQFFHHFFMTFMN